MAADLNTSPYRVTAVGCSYNAPAKRFDENGDEIDILVARTGHHGETVELNKSEAARLTDLGAVQPTDAPLGYSEQTVDELQAIADERGLEVSGSGANGGVLKQDLVTALETFDAGQSAPTKKAARKRPARSDASDVVPDDDQPSDDE